VLLFNFLKYAYINKKHLALSKKEIKQLQQKKFLKLVQFVAKNSPYYQKVIKEFAIDIDKCVPEDFPVLTKQKLIEEFDTIVTDKRITKYKLDKFFENSQNPQELFLNKYYAIHTSGSSGTVGYYVYTPKEFAQGISVSSRISNFKLLQKLAHVGASKGHFAGVTIVTTAMNLPFLYKEVQTIDMNQPFSTIVDKLNAIQPTNLGGYAFSLKKLADAQKEKRLWIKPQVISSGGEPLSIQDKNYIQDVFKAPVINVYAASEYLIIGIGKDSFGGMYLMEDNLYFEIKQKETNITNLYNYTLPLIRYQMTDLLEITKDTKNIMPFTKVKEVIGRKEDMPIFLNVNGEEDFINPAVFRIFFVQHLLNFQIIITDKKGFIFSAHLEPDLTNEIKEKTIKNIKQGLAKILDVKMMSNVKFTIKIVANLQADPKTGKFKMIVKKN